MTSSGTFQSMDSISAAGDLIHRLLEADLDMVWDLNVFVYRTPPLRRMLDKIVSAQPLRDITLTVWFVFLAYVPEFGLPMLYACTLNLVIAGFLRAALRAPRPFEYDERLKPLTDRYEWSYGFPSLESYMSVIVFGLVWRKYQSVLMGLILLCLAGLVGFTRVYACSRFVHQVIASWLLGFLGLQITITYLDFFEHERAPMEIHAVLLVLIVLGAAGYVAYFSELNESYLLKLPKEEYTRVLKDILEQDSLTSNDSQSGMDAYGSMLEEEDLTESAGLPTKRAVGGKDSFFFLEQTVMRRKVEEAAAKASLARGKTVRWAENVTIVHESSVSFETT